MHKHSAQIKDVYIELKDYQFFHSPYRTGPKENKDQSDDEKSRFIGRERIKKRLTAILSQTATRSGSYLITGFRGMGKTSLVRQVLEEFRPDNGYSKLRSWWLTKGSNFTRLLVIGFLPTLLYSSFSGTFVSPQGVVTSNSENWPLLPKLIDYFANACILVAIGQLWWNRIDRLIVIAWNSTKLFITLVIFYLILFLICSYNITSQFSLPSSIANWVEAIRTPFISQFILAVILTYFSITLICLLIDIWAWMFNGVFSREVYVTVARKFEQKVDKYWKKTGNKEKHPAIYQRFEINLSQDSLEEMDVLRRMAISLEGYWQEQRFDFGESFFSRSIYLPWIYALKSLNRSKKESLTITHAVVLNKLSDLRNRMSGEVTTRKEAKFSPELKYEAAQLSLPLGSVSSNDEINYPLANSKEAEDLLRSILDDIEVMRGRDELSIPQFVFVIDELDKIEPIDTTVHPGNGAESDQYAHDTNRIRLRREAVARLLANMKGFLNVAKAKFFFIGGREMFDADLAGISDRESFYSSIFNDVIYVDSFFKDTSSENSLEHGGLTRMTEAYVTKLILNKVAANDNAGNPVDTSFPDLQKLFEVMDGGDGLFIAEHESEPPSEESPSELTENRLKQYKVIFTLQNFITYLTYRSSGTPKKLAALTERLIVSGPTKKGEPLSNAKFFRDNLVVLGKGSVDKKTCPLKADLSERMFLRFGYATQYEIGLTSNLYRPYLLANVHNLRSLGDKLLYSSAFILDHILKFHPFGFSWRNLELIPEIILVNREPNLREFIEELMRFYSSNYIRTTVSGIFDYRFRSIIRRELIYLSKTSDISSAAFNFTLDESLSIKRHYRKKLFELRDKYANFTPPAGDNHFVHSLGFIQTILGDLHFYDKEYDEAIVFYAESIQTLRLPDAVANLKMTRHQFFLWLRNKLKLGLTLEKIRAFDSAYSVYKTLSLDMRLYLTNMKRWDPEDHRNIHMVSMPFVALLAVTEKARVDGVTYKNLTSNRDDFYETINFSMEPPYYNNRRWPADIYRKHFLLGDYYNNVGSILFYRNSQFNYFFLNERSVTPVPGATSTVGSYKTHKLDVFQRTDHDPIRKIINDQHAKLNPLAETPTFRHSLTAFSFYWNSLYFLLKSHDNHFSYAATKTTDFPDNLLKCTANLLEKADMNVGSNRLYYIANVISKIGDCIFASLSKDDICPPKSPFEAVDKEGNLSSAELKAAFGKILPDHLFTVETVLYTYKLAAAIYKKAGYSSYYASHLIKLLYVIKDVLELNKESKDKRDQIIKLLLSDTKESPFGKVERIAIEVFRATTLSNEIANRPQVLRYNDIFNLTGMDADPKDESVEWWPLLNNLNNIADNKEAVVLVESIKMKVCRLAPHNEGSLAAFASGKSIVSAYSLVSNRYQRMLELKYRTERCYHILSKILGLGEILNNASIEGLTIDIKQKAIGESLNKLLSELGETRIEEVVEFLIKESLFCSIQLIKMIKLYNPGFLIGYSFIAKAHQRMGDWCRGYKNFRNYLLYAYGEPRASSLDKSIAEPIGEENLVYLNSYYHYEAASQYYGKMLELHSEGKTYTDKLHEVYMLEDDYNDNMSHFTIAAERIRINTGNVSQSIETLKGKLNNSILYKYSNHVTRPASTPTSVCVSMDLKTFLQKKVNDLIK